MKIISLILVLLFFLNMNNTAQTRVIEGKVTLENGSSLGNITVASKKMNTVVKTDSFGYYKIVCSAKNDVLTYSNAVMTKVSKKTNGIDTLNVIMAFAESSKEDVDQGYGKVEKENTTQAVTHMNVKKTDSQTYSDIYDMISGRVAGVQVINARYGKQVQIRGIGTINNSYAIYDVDGRIVEDISYLNPSDVKSIDVLKGADASIYGTRGSNGVIIIRTSKNDTRNYK